jgi:hypothetical protein
MSAGDDELRRTAPTHEAVGGAAASYVGGCDDWRRRFELLVQLRQGTEDWVEGRRRIVSWDAGGKRG